MKKTSSYLKSSASLPVSSRVENRIKHHINGAIKLEFKDVEKLVARGVEMYAKDAVNHDAQINRTEKGWATLSKQQQSQVINFAKSYYNDIFQKFYDLLPDHRF